MESNLSAALRYLEMGWPVFPARKDDLVKMNPDGTPFLGPDGKPVTIIKSKTPLIEWKTYQVELPEKEEVEAWWKRWPDALIGVATGKLAGFVVVDTEKGADLSLYGLEDIETPSVATGGGGIHYYFAYEPLKNSVKFAPLYDFRADGGYVVIPPSGHKSGGKYEWINVFGTVPLAPLPDAIRQALKGNEAKTGDASLDKLLTQGVGEGERNASSTRVVGSLLAHFPVQQWESVAWPMFQSWNSAKCRPPQTERELRTTFDSISKAELAKRKTQESGVKTFAEGDMVPRVREESGGTVIVEIPTGDGIAKFSFHDIEQSTSKEIETLLAVEVLMPGSHPKPFTARINLVSLSTRESFARQLKQALGKELPWDMLFSTAITATLEYLSSRDLSLDLADVADEEAPILFDPFLVKDGANLLFGDGGTGKTYFCLRLALSFATGEPFLGFTPKEVGGTLFVDYEDNEKTASFRLSRLCADPKLNLNPKLAKSCIRYLNPQGAPLHTIIPALKKIIREHNIALILVDSVASACGSEPEKAEAASKYYNALKSLNITSLSIAHVVKTEGVKQDKAFGSVFWHNLARNTWNIQGEEDQDEEKNTLGGVMSEKSRQLGMFHRKFNGGAKSKPINMRIVYAENHVRFEEGKPDFWNKDRKLEDRVLTLLRMGPKTKAELSDELINVPDSSLKNTLAVLKGRNLIGKEEGKGGVYKMVAPVRLNSTPETTD